ncbi:MAG TPA: ABC transporter permease [Bacteroidales bacterium]|nr:ABC transporter permease [Bacteroidales bacterium]
MKTRRIILNALKNLAKYKLRSFLMMLGIIIGILALTMVISIGLGVKNLVMERVKKFGLESLMINANAASMMGKQASPGHEITTLTMADADYLSGEVRSISEIAPFNRRGNANINYFDKSTTAALFGVTPTWAYVWDWDVTDGEFINDEDMTSLNRVCLIGPTVRKELFGDNNPIGEQIQVGNVQFIIKGILVSKGTSAGGGDMDNRVMIPLSTFMRRVANVDYLAGIKVLLNSNSDINKTRDEIISILRERHKLADGVPDDFTVISPDEVTEMAERISGTFNLFLVLLAGISLITGGIVVANIMFISVNERKKEIGLRKAIGANIKDIMNQFLFESSAVTLMGGLIGIILGAVGAKVLNIVFQMPISISWTSILIGVISSTIVGIIAGVQPARRAAGLQPVDALR